MDDKEYQDYIKLMRDYSEILKDKKKNLMISMRLFLLWVIY